MSEQLRESLSALMDNETDELELRRILKASAEQSDLLEPWERYHLISDILHHPDSQSSTRPSILAGVQSAIADDAPYHSDTINASSRPSLGRFGRALGQASIAASVAFAVLFTANTLRSPDSPIPSGASDLPGQLSANTNNTYVEGEFNRVVSFNGEARQLDPQTLERLREAIYREFEQYSLAPQLPALQESVSPE